MRKQSFFLFLLLPYWGWSQPEWVTYTNTNYVKDVEVVGSYVYAATPGGLLKIDTADFSVQVIDNTKGLMSIVCNALAKDNQGNLWIGCEDGALMRMDTSGRFTSFSNYRQAGWNIRRMRFFRPFLLISADKGLSIFSVTEGLAKQNFVQFSSIETWPVWDAVVANDTLFALLVSPDSIQSDTLASIPIDLGNLRKTNLDDPTIWSLRPAPSVISLGVKNDTLLISSNYDVDFVCGDRYESFLGLAKNGILQPFTGLTNAEVLSFNSTLNALAGDPSCGLWLASAGGGVLRFDGQTWQSNPQPGPVWKWIPENRAQHIYVDKNRVVWITTGADPLPGRGMNRLIDDKWEHISSFNNSAFRSEQCDAITRILEHPQTKELLFSSWGGGITMLNQDGNWSNFGVTNSPLQNTLDDTVQYPDYPVVSDMEFDAFGRIWAANLYRGIAIMDLQGNGFLFSTGKLDESIYSMVFDSQYRLWVGYLDGTITVFDTTRHNITSSFCSSTNPVNGGISSMVVDSLDRVWVGTSGGLHRYAPHPDLARDSTWRDTLQSQDIRDIAIGPGSAVIPGGAVFIASYGRGIMLLDTAMNVLDSFTTENSQLVSNDVHGLHFDSLTGFLWVGTDKGISVFRTDLFPPRDHFEDAKNPVLVRSDSSYYQFDYMPDFSKILLYTIDGYLVKQINAVSQRDVRWYLNNGHGASVKPGVYYYAIQGPNATYKRGKVIVK